MTQIKDTLGGLADKATQATSDAVSNVGEFAGKAGDSISQFAGSDEMKKLLPYLLSGGVGAAAGGLLTSPRRAKKGEGRLSHLGRVLSNALMAGGLAAGSAALLRKGYENTLGSPEAKDAVAGAKPTEEGPLDSTMRGALFSPLTAAGAGATGLYLTNKAPSIGAGVPNRSDDLKNFISKLQKGGESINKSDLRHKSPMEIQAIIDRISGVGSQTGVDKTVLAELSKLRRGAGVGAGHTPLSGFASKWTRKGPLSTFGQSWPRRAGRGALAIGAAAIPALVGSFITEDKNNENA